MKNKNRFLFWSLAFASLAFGGTSCSDFDEININPSTAGKDVVKPYYALNKSIVEAQQNPHIHERVFVYNWASAARIAGEMGFLNLGRYSDSYNSDYFSEFIAKWINNATLAITLTSQAAGQLTVERDLEFNENVKAFARIWRANMIAEFTDNFGPYPLDAFQGVNPTFNSVEEVYDFILKELKEATAAIKKVAPTEMEKKSDPIFEFDSEKWIKFGNSLRMRYAMRLSEVDRAKAKAEFEDAAKGQAILSIADMAKVKEFDQWNAWAGVYSRPWNTVVLSSTMSNILVGLGGVSVSEQRPDLAKRVKAINYLGMKFDQHYAENTDNPTKQFWMDGIPEKIDPRGLEIFCLPNDSLAENFIDKGSKAQFANFSMLMDKDGQNKIPINAEQTWNSYPVGQRTSWSDKFAKNEVMKNNFATCAILGKQFCKSTNERVWLGPWETYFLLAEAACYGWNVGTTAEAAYENGVKVSFEHFGVSQYVDQYLNSTDYNRVGTSVKFTHTVEPKTFKADYVDGYTKAAKTMDYQYPNADKILYKGHKLNDQLTKIITQKYIAQTPYGALEMWNDHRRLGLPFFDMPANESMFIGSDMEQTWTSSLYLEGQKFSVYPQRLRYPSSLQNADPVGYKKALELLGGQNTTIVPLWWSLGANK